MFLVSLPDQVAMWSSGFHPILLDATLPEVVAGRDILGISIVILASWGNCGLHSLELAVHPADIKHDLSAMEAHNSIFTILRDICSFRSFGRYGASAMPSNGMQCATVSVT
jgi:hypothetical protein